MPLTPATHYFLSAFESSCRSITEQFVSLSSTLQTALHGANNTVFDNISPAVSMGDSGVIKDAAGFFTYLQARPEDYIFKGVCDTANNGIAVVVGNWRYNARWVSDQISSHNWEDQVSTLAAVADFASYTTEYLENWKNAVYVPAGQKTPVLTAISAQLTVLKMISTINRAVESLRSGLEHRFDSIDNGALAAMRHAVGDLSSGTLDRLIMRDIMIITQGVDVAAGRLSDQAFDDQLVRAAGSTLINNDTLNGWTDIIRSLNEGGLSWLTEAEWNEYRSFLDSLSDALSQLPEGGIAKLNEDFRELENNAITLTGETMTAVRGHYIEAFNALRNTGLNVPQMVWDYWTVSGIPNNTLIVSYFFQTLAVVRHAVSTITEINNIIKQGGGTVQFNYAQFIDYMERLFVEGETG